MNWFESITGFAELDYEATQGKLAVAEGKLKSRHSRREFDVGEFTMPSLGELRSAAVDCAGATGKLRVSIATGDVRQFLRAQQYQGALFQVASQFNMLEMMSPDRTPEDGVTMYQHDPTQGPACAVAAGAATIYRNYLVPVAGGTGQRADRQLDGLADVGFALSKHLQIPVQALWNMKNGYALCTVRGLTAINGLLRHADAAQRDELRALLRIGLHRDVQITDAPEHPDQHVSQAFCSALPVAYSDIPSEPWADFAKLVLEAAYEATLWAAVLNACRGKSNTVFLTSLGGGAFGNKDAWIYSAMERALTQVQGYELDVRLVSYQAPALAMQSLATCPPYFCSPRK